MKIYISGAIHLQPAVGEKLFRLNAGLVELRGHTTVVPHDIPAYHPDPDDECPSSYSEYSGHTAACYLRGDLIEMLKCDAVLMIGNWENSVGAQREHSVACWAGIPVYYSIHAIPDLNGSKVYNLKDPRLPEIMERYGNDWINKTDLNDDVSDICSDLLYEMIKFVTGKEIER